MRAHYDLEKSRPNPYAVRWPQGAHAVVVDDEVWNHFGSVEAVQEALRLVIAIRELAKVPKARSRRRTKAGRAA
jgi:hypothetical protein